jgi:hypothetical protein
MCPCFKMSESSPFLFALKSDQWEIYFMLKKLFAVFRRVPSEPGSNCEPFKRFYKFSTHRYVTILYSSSEFEWFLYCHLVYCSFHFPVSSFSFASISRSVCLCGSLSTSPQCPRIQQLIHVFAFQTIRSIGLWRWYIHKIITILDVIHRLLLKTQFNSIGLSVPHSKHTTSRLRAQKINAIYRFVTMVYKYN